MVQFSFTRKADMSPGQRDTGDVVYADDINELQEALENLQSGAAPIAPVEHMRAGVVNVLDYGAVGDGVTDDTAAIRAAYSATPVGGTLFFPSGKTYIIKNDSVYAGALSVGKAINIVSNGATLKASPSSPEGIRMIAITSTSNVLVEGLAFDPNGITAATCTYLKNASFVVVRGNRFIAPMAGGMLLDGNVTDSQFVGNRVNGRGYGVLANDQSGHERILVASNTFNGGGLSGDAVEFNGISNTHYDVSVIGNTITNYKGSSEHAGFGIGFANVTRGVISGNTVSDVSRSGIHIECLSEGIAIESNVVFDCDHGGIEVQSELGKVVKSVVIRGNVVRNCANTPDATLHLGRGGIDLGLSVAGWLTTYGTKYCVVQGNLIEGCYGAGIYATGVTESSIVGNVIRDVEGDSVDTVNAIHNTGIHLISCDRTLYALNQVADNRGGSATTYYPYYIYGSVVSLLGIGNQAYGTLAGSQDVSTGHGRTLGAESGNIFRFDGGSAKAGFYGATPGSKPSITGSRGGNAALGDLLTKLASLGLITDSTS